MQSAPSSLGAPGLRGLRCVCMYTVGLIIIYLSGDGAVFGGGRDHKITTQRASTSSNR